MMSAYCKYPRWVQENGFAGRTAWNPDDERAYIAECEALAVPVATTTDALAGVQVDFTPEAKRPVGRPRKDR